MLYQNREEAGRRLARQLGHLKDSDPIVLALPRGGVVVGHAVAAALEAPLDVIVVRKLGAPHQPEFGFGAIAHGVRVIDETTVGLLRLTEEQIERVAAAESAELERRERLYRQGMPPLELAGRTVVIVDDGLATGGTARAAVEAVRSFEPERIVLAVPVSPPDTAMRLEAEVDEMVCLSTPANFAAVGRWYLDFDQTTDSEVIELLQQARDRINAASAK